MFHLLITVIRVLNYFIAHFEGNADFWHAEASTRNLHSIFATVTKYFMNSPLQHHCKHLHPHSSTKTSILILQQNQYHNIDDNRHEHYWHLQH